MLNLPCCCGTQARVKGSDIVEAHMSALLRYLARCGAYSITLLLAAVWTVGGLESLTRPLFDLGKPLIGDVIIIVARAIALPSETIVVFALLLVGLKFMVGAFLLAALFSAAYEKIHFGSSDDAMLDVALLTSAIATIASALPGLIHGGELLLSVIGELMLCVIASGLAIYGRGFLVKEELPPPTRSEPVVIQVR
jgi:hypothetical protein